MDARREHRKQARNYYDKGSHVNEEQHGENDFGMEVFYYQRAIKCLSKFPNWEIKDLRFSAKLHHYLGDAYFNLKNHQLAAETYHKGIQNLSAIPQPEDKDFRSLMKLAMNLSDALASLFREDEKTKAFMLAIDAFNRIQDKSEEEKAISQANDNYKSFRAYVEEDVSTSSYLNSTRYKNQERMLYDAYNEQMLGTTINNLSLTSSTSTAHETTIPTHSVSMPTFFSRSNPIEDDKYRSVAVNLMQFAQGYFNKGEIESAIKTCDQASEALKYIKNKTQSDMNNLHMIEDNLEILRERKSIGGLAQGFSSMGIFSEDNRIPQPSPHVTPASGKTWAPR